MTSPATPRVFAAVDIGASGGRVMAGEVSVDHVGAHRVQLHTVHRFPNGIHEAAGHLRWNIGELYEAVLTGLGALVRDFPAVESIGIDTWAVDYALLDHDGEILADPIAYRDDRTAAVIDEVHSCVSAAELYEINGLQHLPFTTLYQLAAEQHSDLWPHAAHALLLPDLLAYWLTGEMATEYTNASTTGLVDVHRRGWSTELQNRLDIPSDLFPPLAQPGTTRGVVKPALTAVFGLPAGLTVTTVGSHDTASAVVGVPAAGERFAYVASGTWSLVGLELPEPVVTAESRAANFTNEAGVDGRIRFLRNVGGLWLLQESLREWAEDGTPQDLATLLAEAARLPISTTLIDVDDEAFIAPGNMPARITAAILAGGGAAPTSPAELTACIIDSLAAAYARTVDQAAALAGREVDVIHIVGGGSQNELLCRRTAHFARRTVVAGPIEATALGNICVQAMTAGALPHDLDVVRSVIARSSTLVTYPGVESP